MESHAQIGVGRLIASGSLDMLIENRETDGVYIGINLVFKGGCNSLHCDTDRHWQVDCTREPR